MGAAERRSGAAASDGLDPSQHYTGLRATVMGLGLRGGGVGVARYLAEAGATVIVTDAKPAEALTEPMAALDDVPIEFVLGGHRERDFTAAGADLVVRNPGVPRDAPLLALARRSGVPVEMEMSLFFRACPAPIIGVTGTKGKTTVSTLCAEMLRCWRPDTVLAGNMGVSALAQLPRITPETPVVVELSSWQLEGLAEHRLAPRIAILTVIAEDHLDTYEGFADYAATKRGITGHQGTDDLLVVNADDPESWLASRQTRAQVVPFGLHDPGTDGAWAVDRQLIWRWHGQEERVRVADAPALDGSHNLANALAAMAAARCAGATMAAVQTGLDQFGGVRDRMERVGTLDGVEFINDTAATAPIAAVAALRSLAGRRVHLLTGGADKRLDLRPVAEAARDYAHAVYLLDGSATTALEQLLRTSGIVPVGPFGSMSEAVRAASAAAVAGDVVLLSPGTASFGLFRDEFERGERFREAVRALSAARTPVTR